jgi:hypothetical protein
MDGRADLLFAGDHTPASLGQRDRHLRRRAVPRTRRRHRQGAAAAGLHGGYHAGRHFKGQSEPVSTVGFPTVLITNKDLPEPIAYTVTKTIVENKDALVRGHAGLAEFDPPTAWQPEKVGIPLHPGAERAYREKGWMR